MAENTTEEGGGCCVGVGYRFRPNDEEIINYFLKQKMDGSDSLGDDDVRQIDLCQYDPWEIPSQGIDDDDEWYFFCARPRDYFEAAGLRLRRKLVSRKTKSGYWKLDGEEESRLKLLRWAQRGLGFSKWVEDLLLRGQSGSSMSTNPKPFFLIRSLLFCVN